MSTDRELIELAAKAAGFKLTREAWLDGIVCVWEAGCGAPIGAHRINETEDGKVKLESVFVFNPLRSDGDALRLAVKLGLRVMVLHDASQPKPWLRVEDRSGRWTHAMVAEFENDPYAATRRTITRGAAEIGKAMP